MPAKAGIQILLWGALLFLASFFGFPDDAQARFSMAKYRYSLFIFDDENLKSDYNNINNWKRNFYGPKLVAEHKKALREKNPKMHKDDALAAAEKRRDAYFEKNQSLLSAGSKIERKKELWKIIESFEDREMERLKTFIETYPLFRKVILSYDNVVFFNYEVHAIYTPDHKQRWDVASDIVINLLKNKPSYVTHENKEKEQAFVNNMVDYLTNNFKVPQLTLIRDFMASELGQRYLKVAYATFEERVRLAESIYSENYPYYAALPPEKESDNEFER